MWGQGYVAAPARALEVGESQARASPDQKGARRVGDLEMENGGGRGEASRKVVL